MRQQSVRQWTAQKLRSDDLQKKDLVKFIQDNAARSFLNDHRLLGNIKNVAKTTKKAARRRHNELFVSKRFKAVEEVTTQVKAVKSDEKTKVKAAVVDEGPPKKGDKTNFPKKGCH
ncbi:peptidyl-prolyl cis-trans isomerase FKBP3-like isoform X3 [Stigmatopora argus]